jgi:uncharacterized protein (UPF0297 family)
VENLLVKKVEENLEEREYNGIQQFVKLLIYGARA